MSYCLIHGTQQVSTFHPWASPIGMERPRNIKCFDPVHFQSNSLVSVTHCRDKYEKSGFFWFYAALGCSDMKVNIGNTLITRNRCHAAHILSDYPMEWMEWYMLHAPTSFFKRAQKKFKHVTHILEFCINGVFECKNNITVIPSIRNAYSQCYVSGNDILSKFIIRKMITKNVTSVQFYAQPEGDRWNINHEILFAKMPSLYLNNTICRTSYMNNCLYCKGNHSNIKNITSWRSKMPRKKTLRFL